MRPTTYRPYVSRSPLSDIYRSSDKTSENDFSIKFMLTKTHDLLWRIVKHPCHDRSAVSPIKNLTLYLGRILMSTTASNSSYVAKLVAEVVTDYLLPPDGTTTWLDETTQRSLRSSVPRSCRNPVCRTACPMGQLCLYVAAQELSRPQFLYVSCYGWLASLVVRRRSEICERKENVLARQPDHRLHI